MDETITDKMTLREKARYWVRRYFADNLQGKFIKTSWTSDYAHHKIDPGGKNNKDGAAGIRAVCQEVTREIARSEFKKWHLANPLQAEMYPRMPARVSICRDGEHGYAIPSDVTVDEWPIILAVMKKTIVTERYTYASCAAYYNDMVAGTLPPSGMASEVPPPPKDAERADIDAETPSPA